MHRRDFLRTGAGAAAAGLALGGATDLLARAADGKARRVALIGCGWYGKVDLLRLIQIAPVEVVALCDVDRKMVAEAAEIVASRQKSGKTPRTYHDYRDLLKEQELDICMVATPDHWHALPMIAACEAGADVWVQKPISVDVAEGQAMLDAARRTDRVVQVGTQRRSTPHIIEARDRIIKEGKLGKVGLVELYCYYHMRPNGNPPDTAPPDYLDWEFWTGPAPLRPYNAMAHPRSWRAFREYGNGIVGDMCIHMLDMARWMLDLGWPTKIGSTGGIFVQKGGKANIRDTQTATFDYGDTTMVWQHRTWGEPADPKYPWGATFYGDKGTLKVSVYSYDFTPLGGGEPIHGDVVYELDEYPEDKTEPDIEKHVAPAVRYHLADFLNAIDNRGRPVADIEQGHISTATCILANLSCDLGRTLTWDAEHGRVVGDDEANDRLRRPYRAPWEHPEPGRS